MSLFRSRKIATTLAGNLGAAAVPSAPANAIPINREVSAPAKSDFTEAFTALRDLQILVSTRRLYHHSHPKNLDNLDTAYSSLQKAARTLNGFEVRTSSDNFVVPKLSESPIPDSKSELRHLAADFQLSGIRTLTILREFHIGELDTLVQLLRAALLKSKEPARVKLASWWNAKLLEYGVEGILVNAQKDRKVDTVLASLIGAMVAFGGNSANEDLDAPITAPGSDSLAKVLRLIARLTPPLESARGLSPEEGARGIHSTLAEADRETVRLLLNAISQHAPREMQKPQEYLLGLTEILILENLSAELAAGELTTADVSKNLQTLGKALVDGGVYSGPHSSQHLSQLAAAWADEAHQMRLLEKFWAELPPRERSSVLRSHEIWCVPVSAIRLALDQLADAGADAPRREARNILLNYARRLDSPDPAARRIVASGLKDLTPVIESLWPNQLPEDLSRFALKSLQQEAVPETAALLSAFLESLARLAVTRGDFAGLEGILSGLEKAPKEPPFEHMHTLVGRLIAQDRWLLLVDASLANRPLDPVLPRLLVRDPDRLLDRLTALLVEQRAVELLPPMARLLRTIGVPVLNLLETRLYEARKQRVSAAIKLLAAADPERLLRALPRSLASWEWNLQDLAVSELSRPANAASSRSSAFIFAALLGDAHPLVVPMMIDHIGIAQESSAIPQLMEIAGGSHEILREQFVRIKAIEALARLYATESVTLLRGICEKRDGLTHAEPAGIRAVASDALAVLEERPGSKQVRSTYELGAPSGTNFVVPRRYARVPLESPLRAQIETGQQVMARVKTIGLGGAYLESSRKLSVGDAIKLEVRSGFSKIHFTAVVRNSGPDGNGVEFVHMKSDDRDKLRKLVQKRR
jgi:hypothetical protein